MSGQRHEIHAMIQVKPAIARARIIEALKAAGMHRGDAATALGCSHGTLIRWIAALDLTETIADLTDKARRGGWHHGKGRNGGRPRGSKDSVPRQRRRKSEIS